LNNPENWSKWFRERWFDFRQGHSIYLNFLPNFANFILISFNFLVLTYQFGFFKDNIVLYAVTLVSLYVPVAIVVGKIHNERQLETDMETQARKNPYWIKLFSRMDLLEKNMDKVIVLLDSLESQKKQ